MKWWKEVTFHKDLDGALHSGLYSRRALKASLLRASSKDWCTDGVGQREFCLQIYFKLVKGKICGAEKW